MYCLRTLAAPCTACGPLLPHVLLKALAAPCTAWGPLLLLRTRGEESSKLIQEHCTAAKTAIGMNAGDMEQSSSSQGYNYYVH